jgi:hypothetical protein
MRFLKVILGTAMLMAPADAMAGGGDGPVLEVVRFRLVAGSDEAAFLAAARATETPLLAQPGFVSRRLVSDGQGAWTDVVEWSSMAAAGVAAEKVMVDPAFAPFMGMIDMGTVQMEHLPIRWQMGG